VVNDVCEAVEKLGPLEGLREMSGSIRAPDKEIDLSAE
jgi:hypothetical protein